MAQKEKDFLTLVGVGDNKPQRDDPPSAFGLCVNAFRNADIVFGQLESVYSDRGIPMFTPQVLRRRSPKNITAFNEKGAGFDVMSYACNHAMDYGWEAFYDTLDLFKKNNITLVGAGRNIEEARKPAIIEKKGTKVGFLAYLTIVFPGLIAEPDVPGCAPLRAVTFYQQWDFQPGTPPLIITKLIPEEKAAMEEDIKKLRSKVDVLVVSIHCGVHLIPAVVAMYQKEAAYAAIDAGADLVLQHHAHILKGVEMYKGKAIFYGLGNFTGDRTPAVAGKPRGDSIYLNLTDHYSIATIPGWEKYPYHPDARNTVIAKAYIADKKIEKVTYIPTYINPNAEPEVVLHKDPKAQGCFDYVRRISESEGLQATFSWDGDEVLLSPKEERSRFVGAPVV